MAEINESTLGIQFEEILKTKDNGIHNCFMSTYHRGPSGSKTSGVHVKFVGHHPKRKELEKKLKDYQGEGEIKKLLPFQVESILNTVFRPKKISVVKKTVHTGYAINNRPENVCTGTGEMNLSRTDEDIGLVVINDLFTGSGKTLTSIIGALEFAQRKEEIKNRIPFLMREQLSSNWGTRITYSGSYGMSLTKNPVYSDVIVIMVAKHLIPQWKKACISANQIVGKEFKIYLNPMDNSFTNDDEETKIIIVDSVSKLSRINLQFVPIVIIDEFVLKAVHNLMIKDSRLFPIYGRLLLVSADAGNIREILVGMSRKSTFRQMIGYDINPYPHSIVGLMEYAIPLVSAAILPTNERMEVRDFMVSQLNKIAYEEYTVKYTPSFSSRLFGGNFEMSAVTGKQAIRDNFGIDIKDSSSIGEIMDKVKDTIQTYENMNRSDGGYPGDRKVLQIKEFHRKLVSFLGEKDCCPICLDDYTIESSASLINPCWHILCSKCMRDTVQHGISRCPLCRTTIEGHATAAMENSVSPEMIETVPIDNLLTSNSLFENLNRVVKVSMGLEKACVQTIRCIQNASGNDMYRIVMVVPTSHFYTSLEKEMVGVFEEGSIEILQFKTVGTKRKRVTANTLQKQLEHFSSNNGAKMKILFTTEGLTDSLTGLDFPDVDCIFSLGSGNTLQRLGRLTRLPRALCEESSNKVVRCISLTHV